MIFIPKEHTEKAKEAAKQPYKSSYRFLYKCAPCDVRWRGNEFSTICWVCGNVGTKTYEDPSQILRRG